MTVKVRNIEVDVETAELLEARAAARGLSVSELLADLLGEGGLLPGELQTLRSAGKGPWAPDMLAEDARRLAEFRERREGVPWEEIKAWMESWGTTKELSPPEVRKL
jgi:hypothetical protein